LDERPTPDRQDPRRTGFGLHQRFAQSLMLGAPELRLASFPENFSDTASLSRFHPVVEIFEGPA
jgi:hypothetical protein